jgi:predicted CopG family antitoxin
VTQRLSRVNANVNVTMATADEQIRVTDTVKRELDRRRREGESYNDVLQRMLEDDRDLLAGFGRWSDEQAERVREARERSKQKSKDRMRRLASDG